MERISVDDVQLNYLTRQLVSRIDSKVSNSDVVDTAEANKILKLNSDGKLPADIIEGVLSIENIPHSALERCIIVADDVARFRLTTNDVQLGDTVKVTETDMLYYVKDDSQLNNENGYEVYSSGFAHKLATPRKISLTGDVSGSVDFDGTKDVEIKSTINNFGQSVMLNDDAFGDELPEPGTPGRIFFLKVSE